MKTRLLSLLFSLLLFCPLCGGCTAPQGNDGQGDKNAYEQISQERAKALMDGEEGYIILDVRTEEEFAAGHIAGAILIPDYEIETRAGELLPDKHQLILVYCRSGRRSKNAASALAKMGYTRVKEFGGIIDWPYGTTK